MQFELRLTGKAEQIYEVLPADVKKSPDAAIEALRERLHSVRRDALASAQLMRCKQQWRESVDNYSQAFEHLFDKSYGVRHGMDTASKATLKRDLFVQGLHLKWQERVLPSAESFEDALFQARIAEEQERDLAYKQHPKYQYSDFRRDVEPSSTYASKKQSTGAKPLKTLSFWELVFHVARLAIVNVTVHLQYHHQRLLAILKQPIVLLLSLNHFLNRSLRILQRINVHNYA